MLVSNKAKRNIIKFFCWTAIVANLGMIFMFSNQSGHQSNRISKNIANKIVGEMSRPSGMQEAVKLEKVNYNAHIRKTAHFFEYFILALLLYITFSFYEANFVKTVFFTFLICLLYAVSDEIHQAFVPGRSAALWDVVIDMCGAVSSLTLIYLKRKSRENSKYLIGSEEELK